MGAIYTVSVSAVAVTAAQDFFSLKAAAGKTLKLHKVFISQYSDTGSAEIEEVRVRIRRGATSQGSAGSTPTAIPVNPSAAAASCTVHANDTTIANTGTIVILHEDCFEVHGGYQMVWTPETRPECAVATCITVEIEAAPTDSLTMSGTLYFEEIG